jgi:hypothetical protein
MRYNFLNLFSLMFMVTLGVNAQVSDPLPSALDSTRIIPRPKTAVNFLKLNLPGLALRQFHVQYEVAVRKKVSLALGVRFMPEGEVPLINTVEQLSGINDPEFIKILRSVQINNFAITPELRFYPGKKGYGRGFYIAPYYRYLSIDLKSDLPVEISFDDDSKNQITVSGNINIHNIGLMIGAQWMLSKRIALDWWIIGAQAGFHQAEIIGLPQTDFTANQLKEIRDDIQVNFNNLGQTSIITAEKVKVNTNAFIAATGLRTGLCLGFRF